MFNDRSASHGDQVISTWLHQHRVGVHFCIKVVAYTVILIALVYLYDYNGVNGGHFIYNEF